MMQNPIEHLHAINHLEQLWKITFSFEKARGEC